jgi:hypothetical protein
MDFNPQLEKVNLPGRRSYVVLYVFFFSVSHGPLLPCQRRKQGEGLRGKIIEVA